MRGTILEKIVATKREEVAAAKAAAPQDVVHLRALESHWPRDFYAAVACRTAPIRWIGEIKQKSPSAGMFRPEFDPVELARTYTACGATALSVLTDRSYFGGNPAHIEMVKGVTRLPVLRKDFIIDEYQVFESRSIGADAVLFIADILEPEEIDQWSWLVSEFGMSSLIEVHNEEQLDGVLDMISEGRRTILGINNRDLKRQVTELTTTERLSRYIPEGTRFVAESGIATREDVRRMQEAGASALLIGETFMRCQDIGAKALELFA